MEFLHLGENHPLDSLHKIHISPRTNVASSALVPSGRLNQVRRSWDYKRGWVRAPLNEIVFNHRLTQQARNLWLWLAAIHPNAKGVSWADCEAALACCTTSRRNCLAQLIQEGFVSIDDNGVVTMHDPYIVYQQVVDEKIPAIRFEFGYDEDDEFEPIKELVEETVTLETIGDAIEKPQSKEKPKKAEMSADIIEAWNTCKPEGYSKMRTLSGKQLEAVAKHLKNLSQKPAEVKEFICAVCAGLNKSDFWSKKVDQTGRNFSAVFGYGNPQDTKLKNVEILFASGQDDVIVEPQAAQLTYEEKELMNTYDYISLELQKAKQRDNKNEIFKWQNHLDQVNQKLQKLNISLESN